MFKTTWKSYFKNNEKNTWNLLKTWKTSWNFVSPKKWKPCTKLFLYVNEP